MRLLILAALLLAALLTGCGDTSSSGSSTVERPADSAQIARGRILYAQHCARCHGEQAEGAAQWRKANQDGTWPSPPLDGSGHAWHHPTAVLQRVIRDGTEPQGHMPAWGGTLSESQIGDIIAWFQSRWPDEVYQAWWEMERRSHQARQ